MEHSTKNIPLASPSNKIIRKVFESKNENGSSCPSGPQCGGCATIKKHISTLIVHPLIVIATKHILVPHRFHRFVVNVQPNFLVSVLVEHVDCIVPASCRLPVVVKHSKELVVHRLRRFPGNGRHNFWTEIAKVIS
jgi:hypothetical protein